MMDEKEKAQIIKQKALQGLAEKILEMPWTNAEKQDFFDMVKRRADELMPTENKPENHPSNPNNPSYVI